MKDIYTYAARITVAEGSEERKECILVSGETYSEVVSKVSEYYGDADIISIEVFCFNDDWFPLITEETFNHMRANLGRDVKFEVLFTA